MCSGARTTIRPLQRSPIQATGIADPSSAIAFLRLDRRGIVQLDERDAVCGTFSGVPLPQLAVGSTQMLSAILRQRQTLVVVTMTGIEVDPPATKMCRGAITDPTVGGELATEVSEDDSVPRLCRIVDARTG